MIAKLIAPATQVVRVGSGCYSDGDIPVTGDCIKLGWVPESGKCRLGPSPGGL